MNYNIKIKMINNNLKVKAFAIVTVNSLYSITGRILTNNTVLFNFPPEVKATEEETEKIKKEIASEYLKVADLPPCIGGK